MNLTGCLDVLIPRGGRGLIQSVVKNARVPVIETGSGVCHVYVDEYANLQMAARDHLQRQVLPPLGVQRR